MYNGCQCCVSIQFPRQLTDKYLWPLRNEIRISSNTSTSGSSLSQESYEIILTFVVAEHWSLLVTKQSMHNTCNMAIPIIGTESYSIASHGTEEGILERVQAAGQLNLSAYLFPLTQIRGTRHTLPR